MKIHEVMFPQVLLDKWIKQIKKLPKADPRIYPDRLGIWIKPDNEIVSREMVTREEGDLWRATHAAAMRQGEKFLFAVDEFTSPDFVEDEFKIHLEDIEGAI